MVRPVRAAAPAWAATIAAAACLSAAEPAAAVADAMFNELAAVRWQSPYDDWRMAHPGAGCRKKPGVGGGVERAEDEYSYSCVTETAAHQYYARYAFYAFDLEPLVCRLLEARLTSAALDPEPSVKLYEELRARMMRDYGEGRDPGKVYEFGSARWRRLRLWERMGIQVYLFLHEEPGLPSRVELLARHSRLLRAKAEDEQLDAQQLSRFQPRQILNVLLAEKLRDVTPKLRNLLLSETPQKLDAGDLRAHLQILARLGGLSSGDRRAALLMAADRIAYQLSFHLVQAPGETVRSRRVKAGEFVLAYDWSHLGGLYVYDHALWRHVYENWPDSPWGEWAFLELERQGWYTGAACPRDPATFRRVIPEAERFLERRPQSPHRVTVLFDLAAAYETWWSASQASPEDTYVQAAEYQAGAEEARQKAVSLYQEIVRLAPQSGEALYARRVLPRLMLRLDTGQRRFYCIYD